MRALLVSAVMVCLSLYAVAGCENSTLVVHTKSGAPIKVYVDGSTGPSRPTVGVTVTELTPGQHLLKVVASYMDDYGRIRRRTVFSGNINVRPGKNMDAWVEENKGVAIHDTPLPCADDNAQGNASPDKGQQPDANSTLNESQMYNNAGSPPAQGGAGAAAGSGGNLPAHISDDDFEQLKNTIAGVKYEIKKMDTLKILTGNDLFATSQVGELMGLFSFESNKLTVAKLLYDRTVDRQNYGRLASNFNFDARKEDFKKFMEGK